MHRNLKLLDLPNEVLENILSNCSYDELAKNRVICRKFNTTCGHLLNRGFHLMEKRNLAMLKKVKAQLPRRESERRVHNLARHSDVLTAIETRINMLRMSFMKFVEAKQCCFIPGKVIDEILKILDIVEGSTTLPRTHELMLELRDISSMAMEYFDEKIAPNLRIQRLPYPQGVCIFTPSTTTIEQDLIRTEINTLKKRSSKQKLQINVLKNHVSQLVTKVKQHAITIRNRDAKIREQSLKLKQQDATIADLKRHVEEWDLKFADLVAELSRSRDETSSTNSGPRVSVESTTTTVVKPDELQQPKVYKPNIKPRQAQILPRSLQDELPLDLERKRKLPNLSIIPNKMSRLQYNTNKNNNDDDWKSILLSERILRPTISDELIEEILKTPRIKSRKRKSH